MERDKMGEVARKLNEYGEQKVVGSTLEKGKLYSKHPLVNAPFYRNNEVRYNFIKECLKDKKQLSFLDLGCNMGQFLFQLYMDGLCKTGTGCDYDAAAIEIAELLAKENGFNLSFVHFDLNKTDW